MHDYDTSTKKEALFKKVNNGEIRILLGSTQKMGAGTNVQERIVALHHIDAPWRPADIEQRNGRAIRQGNSLYDKYGKDNFKVNIYTYVTQDMLDTVMFEKLHTKQKFIEQIRQGDFKGRSFEDTSDVALDFAEITAAATGDKRILERFNLEKEITELLASKKNISRLNLSAKKSIQKLESFIQNQPQEIQDFKQDLESFKKADGSININGKIFKKGVKDEELTNSLKHISPQQDIQTIYSYNNFAIEVSKNKMGADYGLYYIYAHSPNNNQSYLISILKPQEFSARGILKRVENYFSPDRLKSMEDKLLQAKKDLPKQKASLKEWNKESLLQQKQETLLKLTQDIANDMNTGKNFIQSNPYVSATILGAISGGEIDYNQDGKNTEFDVLLGSLSAIVGVKGLKYLSSKPQVFKNVLKHYFPEKEKIIQEGFEKQTQKEKRGIYNVAYNNKKATLIKQDLQTIDGVLLEKGRQKNDKGYGADHIAAHLKENSAGYVTQSELLNLGQSIREYILEYTEPFIEKSGARVYEWKDKEGIRFRLVVGNRSKNKKVDKGATTAVATEHRLPLSKTIITFYSDRNLKQKMSFKNPKLQSLMTKLKNKLVS